MRNETPGLATQWLISRPIVPAHARAIQNVFADWDVVKLLAAGTAWPYPADGAYKTLRGIILPSVDLGVQWAWPIRLASAPNNLIGVISQMDKPDDNRGFWLERDWQGQGLMREACAIATDYWFDDLGFDVMRVPKALANIASRRISQDEGMRLIRIEDRDYVSRRLPAGIWEITTKEWRARRSPTLARRTAR